jgi:hypothetical protein
MHQAAIKSPGLVGDKLKQHSSEKKSMYYADKGEEKPKVPILAELKKRLNRQRRSQGPNDGRKEHYSTVQGEQGTLCME